MMNSKMYMAFINMTTTEIYNLSSYGLDIERKTGVTSISNLDNTVTVLYAWTQDKSLYKKFRKTRSRRFVYKVVDVEEVDITNFQIDSRLLQKKLLSRDGEVNIVLTYGEETAISDFIEYTMVDIFENTKQIFCTEYKLYRDEYINALDVLNYTYFTDILAGDDESAENAGYTASYGMSPYGSPLIYNSDTVYTYELFMYAFRITMRFKKERDESTRILLNRWGVSV